MYALSMTILIASQVLYQVAQKKLPTGTQPFLLLAVVYAMATVACTGFAFVGPKSVTAAELKPLLLSWPIWLLAATVIGIEIGYLWAYRQGWSVALAFSVASTSTVVLLAIVGLFLFREGLNLWQIVGLGLALAGTWLVVYHR
jgi:drug/metabolite transporter (DMT)-like permease